MSALNSYSFVITLSEQNNYTADFELNNFQISNVNFFTAISTTICNVYCPFITTTLTYDPNQEPIVKSILSCQDSLGIIYKLNNVSLNSGTIKLVEGQDNIKEPISICFLFFKDTPEMMTTKKVKDVLFVAIPPNQTEIVFDLATKGPIIGAKFFKMFSNIYGLYKVSFAKFNSYFDDTLNEIDYCSSNCLVSDNKLTFYRSNEYILNGKISYINPITNNVPSSNEYSWIFFQFYDVLPKNYISIL